MKVAISGKGGVGKTLFSSHLARIFADSGYSVLAIDADPNATLAATLGFPHPEKIVPISEMKDVVAERTGATPGKAEVYFKLNPRVDDIPEKYGITYKGIRLLVMGSIKKAGSGCYCPENALVRELVGHLLLGKDDVVIMDMEAGIEHLGRGTSGDVDAFIIVVEPGKRSVETGQRVANLATDLGIERYYIVGNKVRNDEDRAFIESFFPCDNLLGILPYSNDIAESGKGDSGIVTHHQTTIDTIKDRLIKEVSHG